MRYNEFKKPQLTEEQIVLDYCLGEITKEDAVLHLNELNPLSAFNKLKGIGSKLYNKGKDFFKGTKRGVQGKPPTGGKGGGSIPKTPASDAGFKTGKKIKGAGPLAVGAGIGAGVVSALDTEPKTAQADTPQSGPFKKGDGAETDKFKLPAPKPFKKGDGAELDDYRQVKRDKVKATAANTKDYDKTVALQKKLGVTADGIMGPKTRAAMKAAGMSKSTPGSKVKKPGPSVKQNPAYSQTGMDPVDMPDAKPKIRTDMPGGPTRLNAFKSVYNKATPAQKKAMIARLRQAQAKRNAPPKPTKKPRTLGKQARPGVKKQPRAFGLDFMPRVDDPKGGETVNLPFGMSYKTLPQKDDGVA